MNGNINTAFDSNSAEARQQYETLSNSLSTGSSIAGMPIQSSVVSVNGGTLSEPNAASKTSLILGICIPVAVLCKYLLF